MNQDDMAMADTLDKSQAATAGVFPYPTTATGARNLYLILLGRAADGPARVAELAVQSMGEALWGMMDSAEFAQNIETIVETATMPVRAPVSIADLERAASWLDKRFGASTPRMVVSWAGLLHDALSVDGIGSALPSGISRDSALAALQTILDLEGSQDDRIASVLTFDPTVFVNSPAGRVYGGCSDIEPDMPLPKKGFLPAVLPLFTEGVGHLDGRDRPLTLKALVRATQKAARKGLLKHWLFDEKFYIQALEDSEDLALDEAALALDPYMQFLLEGDRADIAPHPLFSPYAYRKLNPGISVGPDGCFHDYVTRAERQACRTSALFDPEFYLSKHSHVRQEIASGRYTSALEHFIREGLRVGYAFSPDFDRDHYLKVCPDVAEALSGGHIPSAEWHYVTSGAREGRPPNPFFNPSYYTQRYPSVGEEMASHGISSTIEHFLLLGRTRGWRVNHPLVYRDVDIDQAKILFEKRGRRAYSEALAGVFSYPSPPVTPTLSVIVPISGQADFTAGFLKSAYYAADYLNHKRGLTTEIVIVDNGSSDHTDQLLRALPGVKVVRFDKPIGFPAAVNAGASASGGDIIIIANNDIEFEPDAFLRIVDGLSADPSVGVLGAKVILPNETLQEVGSVLDRDGSSHGLGRGMAAVECAGARTFEVDYASGCFIGVRRADFEALNQLDEAYSPGYYEEVDFSIRMKRVLGKITAVDSGLAVTHYEHASFSKGRPATVSAALILKNRIRIRSDHAQTFAAIPNHDGATRVRQVQAAMSGGARVLVIEDMIPSSLLGSGFCREEEILDILTEAGVAFDIVALNPSARVDEYKNPLVRVYRNWMGGEHLDEVLRDHGHKYSHIWLCRTHNLNRAVHWIKDVKARFGTKVICDTEAISSLRLIEQMSLLGNPPTDAVKREMIAAELADPIGVDLWIAVNPLDQAYIEQVGMGPVREVGHAVTFDTDPQLSRPFAERSRVMFIGAVHELSSPNYDSLSWYLSRVAPKLSPALTLTVAGFWATGLSDVFKAQFKDGNIDFIGPVSEAELSRLYAESRLTIAPTRFAAGIPYKVMESVMAGVPVVMTDNLADQFGVVGGSEFASATKDDDGVAFAGWVEKLHGDEGAWTAQRELQTRFIGENSSRDRLRDQIMDAARLVGIKV